MTCRRRRGRRELLEHPLRERPDDDGVDPALEVARDVGDGFALSERLGRLQAMTSAAELADGDFERRARAQRRLLEEQGDVAAVERVARRRLAAQRPLGLELRAELEAALEIGGVEVEDREKVLAGRRRSSHGSGPVVRVDPHVLGAEIARPDGRRGRAGAEIDRQREIFSLQIRGGVRRALVVRPAVLEQDDRSRWSRPPRAQLERHAGAAGDGDEPSPVRVAAVDRRLHERRVGDRLGRASRLARRTPRPSR